MRQHGGFPIVHTFNNSLFSRGRAYSGHLSVRKRTAQIQRGVLLEPEFVQKKYILTFTSNKQCLGCPAGCRPSSNQRIKKDVRINAHRKDGEDSAPLLIENRNVEVEVDAAIVLTTIEILKNDFSGTAGQDCTLQKH